MSPLHFVLVRGVRIGGRFGGRVEASAHPPPSSPPPPFARTGILARKLDGHFGAVVVIAQGGGVTETHMSGRRP
jgi:hypothetical protein